MSAILLVVRVLLHSPWFQDTAGREGGRWQQRRRTGASGIAGASAYGGEGADIIRDGGMRNVQEVTACKHAD
jgi:hypothetical protein